MNKKNYIIVFDMNTVKKIVITAGILLCFSCFTGKTGFEKENRVTKDTIIKKLQTNLYDNVAVEFYNYKNNNFYTITSFDTSITHISTIAIVENDTITLRYYKLHYYGYTLASLEIHKPTILHFLSKYIGCNVKDITDIFGKPDYINKDENTENRTYALKNVITTTYLSFKSQKSDGKIFSIRISDDSLPADG